MSDWMSTSRGTRTDSTMAVDENWIKLLKQHDSAAWDMLLRLYADELRRAIQASLNKRGLPLSLTDDIEQETWLTAVRKFGSFRWESADKLFRWLRAISVNHVLAYRRWQRAEISSSEEDDADADIQIEQFYSLYSVNERVVEDQVAWREQLAAIDRAMRELKPQEREVLMRRLMGESPREIAAALHLKARSVSTTLLRAKEKIEAHLLLGLLHAKDKVDE